MKTASLFGICLLALPGEMVAGQEPSATLLTKGSGEYKAAYQVGRAEADKELRAGRATIYGYGLVSLFEHLDRETGLPYRVIAGCVVDDEILGRADGHNDRIAQSIKGHGLPSNSFKRWEKQLFGLKGYYETRIKSERPHRLTFGGPAVKSSDGRYTIRPIKTHFEKDDGSPADCLGVVVGADVVGHEALHVLWDEGETDFLWGPEGSGFAVIRCERKDGSRYMALDLKRGRWLREE